MHRPPRPTLPQRLNPETPPNLCWPIQPWVPPGSSASNTAQPLAALDHEQSLRLPLLLPREFLPLYSFLQYFWKIKQSTTAFQTVNDIFKNTGEILVTLLCCNKRNCDYQPSSNLVKEGPDYARLQGQNNYEMKHHINFILTWKAACI